MAKISNQERIQYLEKIKKYRAFIDACGDREKETLRAIQRDPEDSTFKRLSLVEEMLNLTSYYIIENGISQSVLKTRNEDALNEGRKSVYKSVIYLEQIVTGLVDAPYSEYEKDVEQIAFLNAQQRYLLIRKMGLAIHLLENAYGENTKWKWAFVELEGRYAALAKNIIDLKNATANMDPRSPNYAPTVYHMRLVKKLLSQAADRYRERYELSTNRIGDFETGILFLTSLRRIHILLRDNGEASAVKRKLDIWETKLKNDKQRESTVKNPVSDIGPVQ
jgi:hypothetical protein